MKVWIVLYNKGCHSCAGEVVAVYDNEDEATCYVSEKRALLNLLGAHYSDEDYWSEEHFVEPHGDESA